MRVNGERDLDVHAGDELGVGKLPDVNVMTSDDARQRLDILSNILNVDVLGCRLEENAGGGASERDRSVQNDGRDEERNSWVRVELAGPVGKPYDESRRHDTNVSKGVTYDVQNHSVHTHVTVIMAVSLLRRLSGQRVIVTIMDARIASLASGMVRGLFVGTEGTVTLLNIPEKRRLLVGLNVIGGKGGLWIGIALTGRFNGGRHTGGNDLLAETSRMNAHIFETGKSRVAALNGVAAIATTGGEATASGA